MNGLSRGFLAALAVVLTAVVPAAAADQDQQLAQSRRQADHHVGYYYPRPRSRETYHARSRVQADATRGSRLAFVTALTSQMLTNPYPPPFAIFAKGDKANKLIIVGLSRNSFNTLYRMRGLLAILTASARLTPLFREYEVQTFFTFFDLVRMLGFKQITVTDGDKFAHQILLR